MKVKGIIIGLLVGLFIAIPIICLKAKNDKLEKENARLQQQVFDYKWQLEQVQWLFNIME
jgi:uncharacterized membrane-anchored protein YhcB (DUF1043 family)